MLKKDYLKLALRNGLYNKRSWLIKAFSVTRESEPQFTFDLKKEPWGYSFKDLNGDIIKIDDSKPKQALYGFKEEIVIDDSWIPNVKADESIKTTLGNLIFNYIVLVEAFNSKIPYINGRVNVGKIDDFIASKLVDTPLKEDGSIDTEAERKEDVIYVDEYLKYVNSFRYLGSLSQLTTIAATKKNIVKPKGIDEFKKKLLKKYEGKLNDPTELVKFEEELKAFDEEYLKDDPSNGKFTSGKIKNIARKKMFLDIGAEDSFKKNTKVSPVLNSLEQGWSKDPKDLVNMYNGVRKGSYSRGAETVKGGVSAKVLLRASNNFSISKGDCGSKLGITYILNEDEISNLVNRYIIVNSKNILIENITQASNYIGKSVQVRSPMYCLKEGQEVCDVCAGNNLNKFEKGLSIPITEISAIILTSSLKKMHGVSLTTSDIDLATDLS